MHINLETSGNQSAGQQTEVSTRTQSEDALMHKDKYHVLLFASWLGALAHVACRDKEHFDELCDARGWRFHYGVVAQGISYEEARRAIESAEVVMSATHGIRGFFDATQPNQ